MALKPLNSVGGFSVGETPSNVIYPNGYITGNGALFSGNVAISNATPSWGILVDNLYYSNGVPLYMQEAAEYMATFEGAAQSACWFWETNNLNQWADKGDIVTLTKRINGGTIGLEDRIKHYEHALHVLGV